MKKINQPQNIEVIKSNKYWYLFSAEMIYIEVFSKEIINFPVIEIMKPNNAPIY